MGLSTMNCMMILLTNLGIERIAVGSHINLGRLTVGLHIHVSVGDVERIALHFQAGFILINVVSIKECFALRYGSSWLLQVLLAEGNLSTNQYSRSADGEGQTLCSVDLPSAVIYGVPRPVSCLLKHCVPTKACISANYYTDSG